MFSEISDRSMATAPVSPQARWEERSTNRVLAARRDLILERSRQLVDAAYELLEEKGLEGLTIRAVLKRTGLSRRAFYERFGNKDELVLAVFEHTIRMATIHYSGQLNALADPMERLKLIVTCLVVGKGSLADVDSDKSSRRGAAMSREHLRLAESRPQDLQAALSPLLTLIAQQLAVGMQAGLVSRHDPQRLASLVYNLVSTTVHTELLTQKTSRPDWARREQLASDIWEFCRRAIAAPSQSPPY
jgi:AcrR family transcriptional regulator